MQGLVAIRAAALMSSGERFAIGTFELHGVADSAAGRPRIEVKFHVDGQHALTVTAVHLQNTGQRSSIAITMREVGAFHWPPAHSESYGSQRVLKQSYGSQSHAPSSARPTTNVKEDAEEHFRAPSDALGPVDLDVERQRQQHRPTPPPPESVAMQTTPPKAAPWPPMGRGQPMSRREELLAQRAAQRRANNAA